MDSNQEITSCVKLSKDTPSPAAKAMTKFIVDVCNSFVIPKYGIGGLTMDIGTGNITSGEYGCYLIQIYSKKKEVGHMVFDHIGGVAVFRDRKFNWDDYVKDRD